MATIPGWRAGNAIALGGVRSALTATHAHLDQGSPAVPTRELAIATPESDLRARLYSPVTAVASGPGLVFFHGGGFVLCNIDTHDSLCRRLAEASALPILSVGYRLAPEAPFPTQLEDGEAALRWARAHAAELGMDPARLLAGGDSAGAYIAFAAAAKLNTEQPDTVAGLLLIYPLLDLDDEAWASGLFAHARIVGRVAVSYIRDQLQLATLPPSLAEAALDPIPPALVIVGKTLDPCRPEAARLAERLRAAGKLAGWQEYPRLPHGFGNLSDVSPAARRAVTKMGEGLAALAHAVAPSN
jgi:acetyl esterase